MTLVFTLINLLKMILNIAVFIWNVYNKIQVKFEGNECIKCVLAIDIHVPRAENTKTKQV